MPKLEHQTLNDRAYAELKKGLMAGQFRPGEIFRIRHLADEYGISVTPVREALQRLVAERSLEVLRNRSIAVPILTRKRFVELWRVRSLLEGWAAELATDRLRRSDVSRLSHIIDDIDRHIRDGDVGAYLKGNEKFHFLIYERADSLVVLRIIQDLWTQVGPFFNCLFEDWGYRPKANEGHRRILDAIVRRDSLAVRNGIVWDISEAADSLIDRLEDAGSDPVRVAPTVRIAARRARRAAAT
jgi:DNA-binding GntR family transcriptional regulator